MDENKVAPMMDVTDYTDPQCPFCVDQYKSDSVRPIDVARVVAKLDEYLSHNDYAAAERHLKYWLEEAKQGNDLRGEFSLREECMGLYRKLGREQEALENAERAIALIDALELRGTVSAATALLNAATVYKAFGRAEKAEPLFLDAKAIYEEKLPADDSRVAGLYNNYALALSDLKKHEEARAFFLKALDVLRKVEGSRPEQAITELNLATLAEAQYGLEKGEEEIENRLTNAETLLLKEQNPHGGNFAFVAEKCASVFGYYGWFAVEAELKEISERIYGGKE